MKTEQSQEQNSKTLNYPQDKFIFNQDHFVCIKGTWGCGKSLAGLYAANRECEDIPNNLYLIIRKEWVDLRDSTIQDWNSEIGRPLNGDKNVVYSNGSVLMFRHGADLNALKNINLGGCLMVQAEEMCEEDLWFLNGRLRRKEGTRQLRLECNYDGHNWIYDLFDIKKTGTLITTNTFDNEKNLPSDYIPNLKLLPKKLRDRYLYGSDADMEGAVWDEFDRGKNVRDPFYIPESWERAVILDHGFTNPTAVLWAAIDWDGVVYIYDEHYEANKTVSHHAGEIKKRDNSNVKTWLIDRSCFAKTQMKGETLYAIADEYKDYGINFQPAGNGPNTLLPSINRVNEYFKDSKLIIFKNCVNTLREVENWKWRKLRPGIIKNEPDEPMDKDDHACDDIRFLIISRPTTTVLPTEPPLNPNSAFGQYLLKQREQKEPIYGRT